MNDRSGSARAPRRRRLCIVVHGRYPVGEPRVAREVRVALDEGFDVDVLAMQERGEPATESIDGARVIRLPIAHRRGVGALAVVVEYVSFTALASLLVAVLAPTRRYDAIHVNNPPDFLILAALAPKLLGARVLFDVHDLAPDMFAMRFGDRRGAALADRVLRVLERAATRLADAVVTVHEPYRRELVARGVPAHKTIVVMNTLDDRVLPPPAARAASEHVRIVYHGTVTPHYGVELLVEAFAELANAVPEARLELYGEGDALPSVRGRAAHLGIEDRVHLSAGYLGHTEVLAEVQGADAGVIPNLPTRLNRFALSSKLFEYVALGVPVVSADLPTIREHFSDDEVTFFRAGDARSLAAALREVHEDPAAAAARVEAARARYDAYRWPLNARRYAAALTGRDMGTRR